MEKTLETLKVTLERLWREYPCRVPLELCQWRSLGTICEIFVTQLDRKLDDAED